MLSPENYQLYKDLCALEGKSDAFYSNIQEMDGKKFHVFSYRIASYSDWQHPGALESRGIMFELEYHNNEMVKPLRLVSRSMQKFFNVDELPFTMNLDFSQVEEIQAKIDGSLMSTYLCNDKLYLKSKTSLHSEHCQKAMEWLTHNLALTDKLYNFAKNNYTVNLEWISPEYPFRIVVLYPHPKLLVLNVRHNETGNYVPYQELQSIFGDYLVENKLIDISQIDKFLQDSDNETNCEGYVFKFKNGLWAKKKNNWYSTLHRSKDSINSLRQLFECVLQESSDDLKGLFHDDPYSLKLIEEMEEKVSKIYNSLVKNVENYYNANKHLSRKDYAILGKQSLSILEFPPAMNLYIGKENNYKELLIKRYDDLGIK